MLTVSDVTVRASNVLAAIADGCDGLIEFRAFPSKARTFVAISAIATAATFCQSRRDEDVFFGVATRGQPETAVWRIAST